MRSSSDLVGWVEVRNPAIAKERWVKRPSLRATLAVVAALCNLVSVTHGQDTQSKSAAKIMILCCDYPSSIPVRSDPDPAALAAAVVLVAARSPVIVLPTAKASELQVAVSGKMPQEVFLARLQESLLNIGAGESALVTSLGYNGYEQKHHFTESVRDTPWVLELRFLAEIAQTTGGFMPSVGVYFRLIRTSDQRTLTSGTFASVNAIHGEPNFFTRPRLTPFLVRVGTNATGRELNLVSIDAAQLRPAFDPKSQDDVQFMEQALRQTSEQMASKLAMRLSPLISSANP